MTKEEFLKGTWWLITAKYPVACTAEIYEVVQSENNPVEEMDISDWNQLADECIESYSYLGEDFAYDDTLEESEEEQYDDWYDEQLQDIEIFATKITKDNIDSWGVEWLSDYIV